MAYAWQGVYEPQNDFVIEVSRAQHTVPLQESNKCNLMAQNDMYQPENYFR